MTPTKYTLLKHILPYLLAVGFVFGCNAHTMHVQDRPPRRIVRTWVKRNGCFVRRVIIPCYSHRGNLKHQTVRCPNGRFFRRTWLRRDTRCERESGFIP
ncbi:MAG: hypothetical protein AAGJ35_05825 [Myxococcota bacterium]